MSVSIDNLPDDILLEFFSRYVSIGDLGRLEQVCRRFHSILRNYSIPWKKALGRLTNVSLSQLKNTAGCPAIQVRSFRKKFPIPYEVFFPLEYSSSFISYIASIGSS